MSLSLEETRLLELERAAMRLNIDPLEKRVTALEQSLAKVWGIFINPFCFMHVDGLLASACTTTPVGLPGVDILFTAQPSGMETTLTTDGSGNFDGDLMMHPDDTAFDVDVPSPPARFAVYSSPSDFAANCGGSLTKDHFIAADTGYLCLPWCATPAKLPLVISDTYFGAGLVLSSSHTLVNSGGSAAGACNGNTCAAVNDVGIGITLGGTLGSPTAVIAYSGQTDAMVAPHCPIAWATLSVLNRSITTTPGTTSCPVGLSQDFTWTNACWGASGTLTVEESP